MTYLEVISNIDLEVVTSSLWGSDAEKYSDLRNLLYVAALTIAVDLPLSMFDLESASSSVDSTTLPDQAPFPNDIFKYRKDLGVSGFTINGDTFLPAQQSSFVTVAQACENESFYAADETLFAIHPQSKMVFGLHLGNSVLFQYLPVFTEPGPSENELSQAEYPLTGNYVSSAVNLVSAHLAGNRKRDSQASRFNMILSNLYGGAGDGKYSG